MRVLVFGRSGQLAQALAAADARVTCVGREAVDLADPAADVAGAIDRARPDLVINAAAYTAVDRAEAESEAALRLNRDAVDAIARASAAQGAAFVQVSTDYVFGGAQGAPFAEDAPRAPLGVYGRSKAQGEDAALAVGGRVAVVRISWLYGAAAANFPKTMLRLASQQDEVRVVADQHGRPTYAPMAARALLALGARLAGGQADAQGVFHLCNRGDATWAQFAEALFALSAAHGGPSARVTRITTADYPTPARRPADSRLDPSKLERLLGAPFPPWREGLEAFVREVTPVQEPA